MNNWNSSLCSCNKNCSIFAISCICPCITTALLAEKLNKDKYFYLISSFFLRCFMYAHIRKEIRNKFDIKGNSCNDFCIHCCCTPCAMTQEYNEITSFNTHNMDR